MKPRAWSASRRTGKGGKPALIGVAFLLLQLFLPPLGASHADPGNSYCIIPPFISGGIKPNLLLMIDNSAGMYDLRYQDSGTMYCANNVTSACTPGTICPGAATCNASGVTTTATSFSPKPCASDAGCSADRSSCSNGFCSKCNSATGTGDCVSTTVSTFTASSCRTDADCRPPAPNGVANDTCNNRCDVTHNCFDTTYDNATSYYGYFDTGPTGVYSYDFAGNKFTRPAAMPEAAQCSYSAGSPLFLCVKTTGTAGSASEALVTTQDGFTASGNFLNWLTMSKFDIEKQILTGGKFDSAGNVLIAESRGCVGRRFLKAVPGLNLSFAIRGGTPGGIGSTQSQATEYGQTYIELFAGSYNASDCLAAMNDWLNIDRVKLGPFQNDMKRCVGAGSGVLDATSMWNHILHDCYQGMTSGAQEFRTNLNALEGECSAIYPTLPAASIRDTDSAVAVCSSALTYQDADGNSQSGYLGTCYNTETESFSSPCDATQMANYCRVNIDTNAVIDPPSASFTTDRSSATGLILEQGLANSVKLGRLTVQIAAAEPVGLIDRYKDRIRFGAITFQNNGSASECGNTGSVPCSKACSVTTTRFCYLTSDCPVTGGVQETCQPLPKTDGGRMLSYVGTGHCSTTTTSACDVDSECNPGEYCLADIGNHSAGLIHAIDGIPATSWTPFAETFYNAIGYFARSNGYTASPPTSRSDSGFSSLPAPNTAASYLANKNPSQFTCQRNNILIITDGMSTADKNGASEAMAALYAPLVPNRVGGTTSYGISGFDTANNCPSYSGSRSLSDLAWIAKNRNIKTLAASGTASTTLPQQASESISTYVLYSGPETSSAPGLCDPHALMANTAENGGTTLYSSADNPALLQSELAAALSVIAAQTSSGTAASILSNSSGSGANLLQAVFYPRKTFDNNSGANWIGEMQNLWYYVDPMIDNSGIREDTDQDRTLNLINDRVVNFRFDGNTNTTLAYLSSDTNGDGLGDSSEIQEDSDQVNSLWRAGKQLWARNPASAPRTIYTPLLAGGTQVGSSGLMTFSYGPLGGTSFADNSAALQPYLQMPDHDSTVKLIKYLHGFDFPGDAQMRNRTVQIGTGTGVWKLGDIISSTPRIQSTVRLNSYGLPPPIGYADPSYNSFTGSKEYQSRSTAYVGANDGMLHAFKLGVLDETASGATRARLSGTGLGEERWAYIPKHSLPYLNYQSDPDYNHLYYIDGPTLIVDASIGVYTGSGGCTEATYQSCVKKVSVVNSANRLDPAKNSWRTVLIGGTGLGGASTNSCGAEENCVQTPMADPADPNHSAGLGYSSYFALDVTDSRSPTLLWEFSDPGLGFATSGPAIVRIGAPDLNGKWFAVFGSGPTGPIDTSNHQFMGRSDQNLKFFVVDLKTGHLFPSIDTGIAEAFSGSMIGGSIDTNRWDPGSTGNYQDEAIYVGYTKKSEETGAWSDGGVLRISTNESPDPSTWTVSTVVDGAGPVTNIISRLQDKKNQHLWLYFGTGRYYNRAGTSVDDFDSQRAIYGIKEPCYNTRAHPGNLLDKSCTASVSSGITDQSTTLTPASGIGAGGWRVNLDLPGSGLGAERIVSDAVALTNGAVFFTSFMPTTDACGYGGNTHVWALDYKSGNRPQDAALSGIALIQLSTGEIQNINLSNAFGAGSGSAPGSSSGRAGRRSGNVMKGKPPTDGFLVLGKSGNKPVKRILQIQER